AAYGTLQPLSTPSMPTVPGMGARGFTSPALDRGGYKNAADRFLSKYSQDFSTGYEDDFGIGFGDEGVGSPFTNVGAIAGGALAPPTRRAPPTPLHPATVAPPTSSQPSSPVSPRATGIVTETATSTCPSAATTSCPMSG